MSERVVKIDLKKTEGVKWSIEIDQNSNKVVGTVEYSDDFEGWLSRAPGFNSAHPDLPVLRLQKIYGDRREGFIVDVLLTYECNSPEASYPGRPAGKIKRYGMEPSTGEEPLLTHEMFKDLDDEEKEALQGLLAGSRSAEDFSKAAEKVSSGAGQKALEKIRRGIEAYKNPGLVWVERYTTKNLDDLELDKILKTTNSPNGPCPSAGSDRNWLYLAGPATPLDDGEHWDIEKRWLLSEKGKWDTDLYKG